MPGPVLDSLLAFAALLGACIWIGGFVAIVVVARIARVQLDPSSRVAFFRTLGRSYLPIGGIALALALGAGAWLLSYRGWGGIAIATVPAAIALVLTLIAGVVQAKGMTRLRRRLLESPADVTLIERVRRGAIRATALRGAIAAFSLGLLALACVLAGSSR